MSVWKKASKSNQRTHDERHQPAERQHLGLLEKRKDYVRRARDFNEKEATLRLLRKRALNRNPDEFYHHMVNARVEGGRHFDRETEPEDTPDQVKLMHSQDLKYIATKRTQELKKIDKIQAQLHLSNVRHEAGNTHKFFARGVGAERRRLKVEELSRVELPDVDVAGLEAAARQKKRAYGELAKRIQREKELSVIQQKVELKRHLQGNKSKLKPRRVKKGGEDAAPVFLWKYERKK